jgi:dihydrolipoamide dehydrogenase
MYYEAQKHFKGFGVNIEGLSFDWGQIQKQKDEAVTGLTKGIEGLFKKNKVGQTLCFGCCLRWVTPRDWDMHMCNCYMVQA